MTGAPEHHRIPAAGLAVLVALITVCVVVEAILTAADYDLISAPRLRQALYEFGGFWPGLLKGWGANYAGQPILMFLTYGFLHGDAIHLIVNMITLWSLGHGVLSRTGTLGFCAIYLSALLGGACVYGVLAVSYQPMVGASGALFGLAGALLTWNATDRIALRAGLGPITQIAILLILINVVMWWALDGRLAWQTHLGGFVGGLLAALALGADPPKMDEKDGLYRR